jgi:prepilin-type N-terminal cleavage/methylation domain-containing protein
MPRAQARAGGRDGFTLIEIMAAVFIMAMILTFAFQAYQGISNAYTRVSQGTSRTRAAGIVLDRVERELVGAVLVEREEGADPRLHPYFFYANPRAYAETEGDELRFVTQTPLRSPGSPHTGLALVTYGSAPSQSGPGLALLRQEEPLPRELAKEIAWIQPQIMVDNVATFIARFAGDDGQATEGWDSTAVEQLDKLPLTLPLAISLYEPAPDGELAPGPEQTRTIQLPVRPFKLGPDEGGAGKGGDEENCGDEVSISECLEAFADEIAQSSPALVSAIQDARSQAGEGCWNVPQPSNGLQRLKVLLGGVPGFDAAECQ